MASDVVVVGAGPAGATTAAHLADSGLHVSLLDKSRFPREKVCGDGLTPRTVRELVKLGIDFSSWKRNSGLRVYGGRVGVLELPWPAINEFPDFGLTCRRELFDQTLVNRAIQAGAEFFPETNVNAPILDSTSGRITGVKTTSDEEFCAPIVVAADGNSSRLATAMGINIKKNRPLGVAVRAYYRSTQSNDDYMESWLELWDGIPNRSKLLPGYGWVFPMGDGTCNVGLGMLNRSKAFKRTNFRALMQTWLLGLPQSLGFTEENRVGEIGSAALPMSFNRQPAYARGLFLVGDAGGMVSPFNGEGISYAMEAAHIAAETINDGYARGVGTDAAESALQRYPSRLKAEWGGYFRLGQFFATLISKPEVMRICTKYGLSRPALMKFTMKLLSHLYDTHAGDWMDKTISALARLAPAA
ncbi:MAG: geranylgeranyl reductase family protein [Propionibacteriaceae bacterium]|nr:geranylgeranyl reductase family protein [Propionibacteriaceae bacterium]